MNYCPNCGSNVQPGANVCTECGAQVPKAQPKASPPPNQSYQNTSPNQDPYYSAPNTYSANDPGGFGYGLLGFCIPIVGLILFLVWQDDKPNNAKAAGMGLTAVGLTILFYVILIAAAAGI